MIVTRTLGLLAATMLLLGTGTASAALIDFNMTSETASSISFDVTIDTVSIAGGPYTVGAIDLFFDYDNPGAITSTVGQSCMGPGLGAGSGCFFNMGYTWVDASAIGGALGDVAIGGYEGGTPTAHSTLIYQLTVNFNPGTTWNLVPNFSGPFSQVIDAASQPIPGQLIFHLGGGVEVVYNMPEPGAFVLLSLGLAGLALIRRR